MLPVDLIIKKKIWLEVTKGQTFTCSDISVTAFATRENRGRICDTTTESLLPSVSCTTLAIHRPCTTVTLRQIAVPFLGRRRSAGKLNLTFRRKRVANFLAVEQRHTLSRVLTATWEFANQSTCVLWNWSGVLQDFGLQDSLSYDRCWAVIWICFQWGLDSAKAALLSPILLKTFSRQNF